MTKLGVAVVGDVLDINCWSSTPYFFYRAGARASLFNEPWSVDVGRLKWPRRIWNAKRTLLGRGAGGFQYSADFLDRAEAQIPASYFSSTVISFSQTFPRASSVRRAGGKIYYYVDATLNDLFDEPDYGVKAPASMKEAALRQERENYAGAQAVITMASWARDSLINRYGLPAAKTSAILPGANLELPDGFVPSGFVPGAGLSRDLVLGFVGKDWRRKGLDLLIEARDELCRRGYRVSVRAVGATPDELRGREGVTFSGFIDKHGDTPRFIEAVAGCDVGCLLSTTEALGISTLEFLRVGVPVLGFHHQGLKDTLLDGASIRLPVGANAGAIADRLEAFIRDEGLARSLKERSQALASSVTWARTVERFRDILEKSE